MANRAGFPPGDAREDWAILRALSEVLGQRLPFDSLVALRRTLYGAYPHLAALDTVAPSDAVASVDALAALGGTPDRAAFTPAVPDFYLTNAIARASRVLAECSSLARVRGLEAAE
jgi:NADH-quinone oxidoreductase subunit G